MHHKSDSYVLLFIIYFSLFFAKCHQHIVHKS